MTSFLLACLKPWKPNGLQVAAVVQQSDAGVPVAEMVRAGSHLIGRRVSSSWAQSRSEDISFSWPPAAGHSCDDVGVNLRIDGSNFRVILPPWDSVEPSEGLTLVQAGGSRISLALSFREAIRIRFPNARALRRTLTEGH